MGVAGLVLYAVVLVNTVPRLAGANVDTLALASYAGVALAWLFAALLIACGMKARTAGQSRGGRRSTM